MSGELNWESAFSDDSLDGLIDKASDAKRQAESLIDKASEAKEKLSDTFGSNDEADTSRNQVNESHEDVSAATPPAVTPEPAVSASPAPQPEPARRSVSVQPPATGHQASPSEVVSGGPTQTPIQTPATARNNDDGGGLPVRKIVGALVAAVPLLIAGFVFLRDGGDVTAAVCAEAEQRIAESEAGNMLGDSADSVLPDRCKSDEDDEGTTSTTTVDEGDESDDGDGDGGVTGLAFAFPDSQTDDDLDGVAGSGCTPGDGPLPDGAWFGYATNLTATTVDFDLACAWTGQAAIDQAATRGQQLGAASIYVTNDNTTGRSLTAGTDAKGWPLVSGANPNSMSYPNFASVPADSGLPLPLPVWVYINNGELTEIAVENPSTVLAASTTPVWNCEEGDGPFDAVVQVFDIPANDPDGGLNIRQAPNSGSAKLGTYGNGTTFNPTGGCDRTASGSVWWEVTGQGITGWANSRYLDGL